MKPDGKHIIGKAGIALLLCAPLSAVAADLARGKRASAGLPAQPPGQ